MHEQFYILGPRGFMRGIRPRGGYRYRFSADDAGITLFEWQMMPYDMSSEEGLSDEAVSGAHDRMPYGWEP